MSGRGLSWMLSVGALACSGLLACSNPNFCAGNPDDDCRASWDAAAMDGPACTSSSECAAPNAVCNASAGTCVQCLAPGETSACTASTPVCDADHTCRACEAHSECASQTCLPDGSCAGTGEVAYVSATGSGTACTLASPCPLLADALAKDLAYVKVAASGAANASSATVIDGESVTIIGDPGATVDRDGDGPILEVRSANANVKVYDLRLTGATSASGVGVLVTPNGGMPAVALTRVTVDGNQGGGISSLGGTLTVTQSTVSGNDGGGISVSGAGATFVITNNFIYRNGDQDTGTFGGVNLGIATAGSNVFEFNTVADNRAAINSGGVICNVASLTAPNNVIARNTLAGSATATNAQTSGACTYPTSKIQNDVSGLNFVQPEPPSPFNYKVLSGSTAIDAAATASSIAVDHEGDPRPQGAQKDCGADEYMP